MLALDRMADLLDARTGRKALASLYGADPARLAAERERWLRLARGFAALYPRHAAVRAFSAPGRTEIAGNHTDHQQGRVLCASVDLDILAFAAPNGENVIRVHSEGYDRTDVVSLSELAPAASERYHSASLVRGVAAELKARGYRIGGFDAYTASEVPKGSGLSSSAAFEVLLATILDGLFNDGGIPAVTRAQVAQAAENRYFGKPCGLMDQCGSAAGGLLGIDFADPEDPALVPIAFDFDASGLSLVIVNTGGSHSDLNDAYASIPADMRRAAAVFGKDRLRAVDPEAFRARLADVRREAGDRAALRAMHFFDEDARVGWMADAVRAGDLDAFLRLVNESGLSSWTRLQNISVPSQPEEQPVAVGLAVAAHALKGRGASRVHGGGFAGTIQAFVPTDLLPGFLAEMQAVFGPGAAVALRIRDLGAAEVLAE